MRDLCTLAEKEGVWMEGEEGEESGRDVSHEGWIDLDRSTLYMDGRVASKNTSLNALFGQKHPNWFQRSRNVGAMGVSTEQQQTCENKHEDAGKQAAPVKKQQHRIKTGGCIMCCCVP